MSQLPLSGTRVVEFTHAVMGPTAGLLLADLGAEVIHVERTDGDPTRRLQGFGTGYFPFYSRNKKSLAVDLKRAEGRELVERMIATADVLVENFGPGTMDRLGLGAETLGDRHPSLIYCSLKGFLPGPYEGRIAMDEVVQMMGGLAYMTGPPGTPLRAGTSVVDIGGGMFGVIGILSALLERKQTGRGQVVRSALFETTAFFMGQHMAYAAMSDAPIPPMPARVSAWSIYRTFETADDEKVFVGVISDQHWQRFCEAFDKPAWRDDPRLRENNQRIEQASWLLPAVEALMRTLNAADVLARCERARVPAAPIGRPEDLFEDPQLNRPTHGLVPTRLPNGETAPLPRMPIRIGAHDLGLREQPPSIGQDTIELLSELGFSSETLRALEREGVIATARAAEPTTGQPPEERSARCSHPN